MGTQAEAKRVHQPLKMPKIPPPKVNVAKIETPIEAIKKHKLESPKDSPARKKIKIKEEPQLPRRNVLEPEKETLTKKPKPEIKKHKTEKFASLMSNVAFVLSGFQNPLRGEIRQKALEMGAKYRADWDSSCTHLVCAFANTPKFNQVKGKGKIIQRDWIEKCHHDRKRYPWRRYCLDKADQGQPENEDEVWEDNGNVSVIKKEEEDVGDTDDKLDQIRNVVPKKEEEDYDKDTDEEIEDKRKKMKTVLMTKILIEKRKKMMILMKLIQMLMKKRKVTRKQKRKCCHHYLITTKAWHFLFMDNSSLKRQESLSSVVLLQLVENSKNTWHQKCHL